MSNPPQPNKSIVKFYLSRWKTLENYKLQEQSLNLLFHSYCPNNNQLEQILLMVSALNDFYSTNIFDTYTVAKHILKCNIDKDLSAGNEALVNKIAPVTINGKLGTFTHLLQNIVAITNLSHTQSTTHTLIKCLCISKRKTNMMLL